MSEHDEEADFVSLCPDGDSCPDGEKCWLHRSAAGGLPLSSDELLVREFVRTAIRARLAAEKNGGRAVTTRDMGWIAASAYATAWPGKEVHNANLFIHLGISREQLEVTLDEVERWGKTEDPVTKKAVDMEQRRLAKVIDDGRALSDKNTEDEKLWAEVQGVIQRSDWDVAPPAIFPDIGVIDGCDRGLMYSTQQNTMAGAGETMKSLLMMCISLQEMLAGRPVNYEDNENGWRLIYRQFMSLRGSTAELLSELLIYLDMTADADMSVLPVPIRRRLAASTKERGGLLHVVDGVAGIAGETGRDTISQTDVSQLMKDLLGVPVQEGLGALLIGNTPEANPAKFYGSERFFSGTTGSMLVVIRELLMTFEKPGLSLVWKKKDRIGGLVIKQKHSTFKDLYLLCRFYTIPPALTEDGRLAWFIQSPDLPPPPEWVDACRDAGITDAAMSAVSAAAGDRNVVEDLIRDWLTTYGDNDGKGWSANEVTKGVRDSAGYYGADQELKDVIRGLIMTPSGERKVTLKGEPKITTTSSGATRVTARILAWADDMDNEFVLDDDDDDDEDDS